jgi:hypothetical protein
MQAMNARIRLGAGLALMALAGCQAMSGPTGGDVVGSRGAPFKSGYLSARSALEGGKYDRATRDYAALLDRAGPAEPRVRLEYAHALLRANRFDEASSHARLVALSQTGGLKTAALAVQGTAEHELARQTLLSQADSNNARAHLQAAETALAAALAAGGETDPTGGLQLRLAEIRRSLG